MISEREQRRDRGGRGAITKRSADRARYETAAGATSRSHQILWDTNVRGFGLRVHPSGLKTFVVFYRAKGRKRLLTLGSYPDLTVDQARKIAREKLVLVARGDDPVEVARLERQKKLTFATLADRFLKDHSEVFKKSHKDDEHRIEDYLKKVWGSKAATVVRRSDVAALHQRIGKTAPYSANRTLSLVSKIFNWGIAVGLLPEDHPNPTRGIERFKEHSRDRFLSPEEARRLLKAIDSEVSPYVRAFFWLSLLLGTRKSELRNTRWKDVDFEGAVLRIPDTKAVRKGGRRAAHVIPLSPHALSLFQALPREADNPYVFPGAKEGKPLINVEKAWNRARKSAEIYDVRFHDLRRTVGSWLAQGGVSLGLIGAVLNHSQAQTTAIYARFGERDTRRALSEHALKLLDAAVPSDAR